MPKRHYTDRDRATALAVYDSEPEGKGRETRAAKAAGVPRSSLMGWLADRDRAAPPDIRQEQTEALGDVWARVARLALERTEAALGETADPAKLKDYTVTAAIATDKTQLLSGQPTSRVSLTNEQRAERAAKLLDLATERKRRAAS